MRGPRSGSSTPALDFPPPIPHLIGMSMIDHHRRTRAAGAGTEPCPSLRTRTGPAPSPLVAEDSGMGWYRSYYWYFTVPGTGSHGELRA